MRTKLSFCWYFYSLSLNLKLFNLSFSLSKMAVDTVHQFFIGFSFDQNKKEISHEIRIM
jgi:hypothetical protein